MLELKEKDTTALCIDQDLYTQARIKYWEQEMTLNRKWERFRNYYRKRLIDIYSFIVPKGLRVLELGCGQGNLLAALRPSYGIGIDFSSRMISLARSYSPHLHFIKSDVHTLKLEEKFDYIICSDLINELWDVQTFFSLLKPLCHSGTRLLLNFHSNLWQAPRKIATKIGIARPQMIQNWLSPEDVNNLLYITGFEVIRASHEVLWPLYTPFLHSLFNRILVKTWPFNFLGLTNVVIARPTPIKEPSKPLVSVIVPARSEAGNIAAIFDRIPNMGRGTELIFVEGASIDGTYETIKNEMIMRNRPMTKLLRQIGTGKGDAVRLGFANATGELLMILDADLTTAPEDLVRFYDAWLTGKGDLVNGVRMVYPMEEHAMRFLNLLGNKLFSIAFSFLLGQKVKDTACGTKVLSKIHYEIIAKNRAYFGNFDRFGDWDLLFGAAKYNLKIVDLPVRYSSRAYGETKMQRWRTGLLLLRMVALGLKRLKFI